MHEQHEFLNPKDSELARVKNVVLKSGLKRVEIAQLNNNPTPRAILPAGRERGDGMVWEVKSCLALRFRARSVKAVQWRRKRQLREGKGREGLESLSSSSGGERAAGIRPRSPNTLSSKFSL